MLKAILSGAGQLSYFSGLIHHGNLVVGPVEQ